MELEQIELIVNCDEMWWYELTTSPTARHYGSHSVRHCYSSILRIDFLNKQRPVFFYCPRQNISRKNVDCSPFCFYVCWMLERTLVNYNWLLEIGRHCIIIANHLNVGM